MCKELTNLAVDIPDSTGKGSTTTTGNVIHELLGKEENLTVFVNLLPERYQETTHDVCSRLYTIGRAYNSCHLIDVEKFKLRSRFGQIN